MVWNTLVQPETLAVALGRTDVAVIDCRFSLFNTLAGEYEFEQSHVPGAQYAHLERDLSDMTRLGQGDGRHPFPAADAFTARLGRWGIGPRHQVVAYDHGEGAQAARFWFLMRLLGHEKVAVLDGGWARWKKLGLPVSREPHRPLAAQYPGRFDATRLLDCRGAQAHMDAGGLLVDARAPERFRGENERIDRVAGHVPGAVNRPYADNLHDGRFKPLADLADDYRALLAGRAAAEVAVMCGSGVTACHNILAMERANMRGAKLFTGSWSGWIEDPSRPVARTLEASEA
jgi:thiosulfate/3-mercaptopyruvate sulfurtransferase